MNGRLPLRVAVIGVGSMGRNHARVYWETPDVELVGIADANPVLAESMARKFGTQGFTDFREMLEQTRPDAVTLATPTSLHRDMALEIVQRGVHLLVEKPIAFSIEAGQEIIQAAKEYGVKLMVGHVERFNPAVMALKQHIKAGDLGRVFQLDARRQGPFPSRINDVGVVIDLATHDMDILNYLIGSSISRMHVELNRYLHQSHEDMLSAVLRFESGVIGVLDINWLTPTKIRELTVIGERGMFVANYLTQDQTFYENDLCHGKQWQELALVGVSEGRIIRQKVQRREPLFEELIGLQGHYEITLLHLVSDLLQPSPEVLMLGQVGLEIRVIHLLHQAFLGDEMVVGIILQIGEDRGKDIPTLPPFHRIVEAIDDRYELLVLVVYGPDLDAHVFIPTDQGHVTTDDSSWVLVFMVRDINAVSS